MKIDAKRVPIKNNCRNEFNSLKIRERRINDNLILIVPRNWTETIYGLRDIARAGVDS